MRLNTINVLLAGLVVYAWTSAAPAASSEADLKKLQGTWTGVSHSDKGEKERIRATTMAVKDDTLKLLNKDRSDEVYQIKLDAGQKPKTIDLKMNNSNSTTLGIYAFEGDTVKICIPKDEDKRPTAFSDKETILVFKRKK